MKKIEKDFVLSDSSLNSYGFRLLTSGYQLNEFAKNPIGYYMHERDNGVLVRWEGLRIEGDSIIGKPSINLSNSRGQKTVDEIEAGYLNAASVGHIVVIETSEDPALKLPGQTGVTVTKWYNRECSLVDVPGNFNAYKLYNNTGASINVLQLSSYARPASLPQLKSVGKEVDIRPLLVAALSDYDITEEVAGQLAKEYKNDGSKLPGLLEAFAKQRVDYLMSLSFAVIDKSAQLSKELQQKYLTGWRLNRYLAIGKKKDGLIDNNAFLQFAVDHGYITEKDSEMWCYEESATWSRDQVFDRIYSSILSSTQELIKKSWDECTEEERARLKEEAFYNYKKMYYNKFGVVCKEPFEIKKLNK